MGPDNPGGGLDDAAWAELDGAVEHALHTGDRSALHVVGRGEVSVVVGWPTASPRWAVKRLPPFPDRSAADRHRHLIDRYAATLASRGVRVVPTDHRSVVRPDGTATVYCIQPALDPHDLAVQIVRAHPERRAAVMAALATVILGAVDTSTGLDAQLSNWAIVDGDPLYFDLTTPMLRDPDGRDLLDTTVFLATLPAVVRRPARRWVAPGLLERYHQPRTVLLDLAANLLKEGLETVVPILLDTIGDRVEPAITEAEVRDDYRRDARQWAALQAIRKLEDAWRRRVRRQPPTVLLPGPIER